MKVTFSAIGPDGAVVETYEFPDGADLDQLLASCEHGAFSIRCPEPEFFSWEIDTPTVTMKVTRTED